VLPDAHGSSGWCRVKEKGVGSHVFAGRVKTQHLGDKDPVVDVTAVVGGFGGFE
jgi:hypothetical protein